MRIPSAARIMDERYRAPIASMDLPAIEAELADLEDLRRWVTDPALDAEYSELGWQTGDDELLARIDEYEARREELDGRITSLQHAWAERRARPRSVLAANVIVLIGEPAATEMVALRLAEEQGWEMLPVVRSQKDLEIDLARTDLTEQTRARALFIASVDQLPNSAQPAIARLFERRCVGRRQQERPLAADVALFASAQSVESLRANLLPDALRNIGVVRVDGRTPEIERAPRKR